MARSRRPDSIDRCTVVDHGARFETGRPVTFRFVRNPESAPNFGPRFGQDIEPAGRYLQLFDEHATPPRGWQTGTASFSNPLVMKLVSRPDADIYGPDGWKARLAATFGRKKRALSCHLRKLGYDAVVTCDGHETREIVDLSPVKCGKR